MTMDQCALFFELGATESIMFQFCTPTSFSSRISRRNPPVQRWAEGEMLYQAEYKEQSFPWWSITAFVRISGMDFLFKLGQVFERWCCSLGTPGPELYSLWVTDSDLLEITTATISRDDF